MKKLFTIVFLGLMLCESANAQSQIANQEMTHDGKVVTVAFDIDTDVRGIPSRRKEVLKPFIYSGNDTVWLDEVMVYGRGRYMRERQVNHINGDKDWELGDNQTLKGDKYAYECTTPLKRWMTSANLGLKRSIVGCATCKDNQDDENLAENVALFEEPALPARRTPAFVLANAEKFWDFGQDELEIIFKVSKIEIDSTVFNNEVTFGQILSAVDKIHQNPNYKLDKIQVAGYASPEGPPTFNTWLGENRAKALINYIIAQRPQYNLSESDFEIVNGEENWVGLRRVIETTDMEYKDEVLAIIDNDKLSGEMKKIKIEALNYGWVWETMIRQIYPHLRSARYLSVYYDSNDDKAVEDINAANELIRNGKYSEALTLAMSHQEDMRAHNTIGVALMMQLKFEEAMPWFERALEGNCASAQNNIDAINAEYEFEKEQKEIRDNYLKQYE